MNIHEGQGPVGLVALLRYARVCALERGYREGLPGGPESRKAVRWVARHAGASVVDVDELLDAMYGGDICAGERSVPLRLVEAVQGESS